MIFSLFTLLIITVMIVILVAILNAQSYDDKVTMAFMEEMKQIIGGTISEYKILYYQLKLDGTYEGHKVECLYRRYPRSDLFPQVLLALTPLQILEIKHFPFVYPTIAHGIKFKKGRLECKWDVIQYPKPSLVDLKAILDGLVQAETNFKNRDNDA